MTYIVRVPADCAPPTSGCTQVLDCDTRKHVHTPTLDDFFADLIEEADPEAGIEDAYKKKFDKVFKWKAHRLIAKANLQVPAPFLKCCIRVQGWSDSPQAVVPESIELGFLTDQSTPSCPISNSPSMP